MSNLKGSSNSRNLVYHGKHALLPPKSPLPSVSSSYVDYVPSVPVGSKAVQRPVEGYSYSHHQRTSSESLLIEEQPSWLDDLLNEPDMPVRKAGHRRSSSDSFAYIDVANMSQMPFWGSQEFGQRKDSVQGSFHVETNQSKHKNRSRESPQNVVSHPSVRTSMRDNITSQSSGTSRAPRELDAVPSTMDEKQNPVESNPNDPQVSSERKDSARAKNPPSDPDNKRAKQQFAQRSRVRKLQYIAELERSVQGLQAEWSEVSAEIEFLNQRNLILSMENKALKQRLESLANERLIKYLEHEVLERERGRLRALQQQQQQEQLQPSSSHQRTKSKDLDVQLANLSLRHKETSSGRDAVGGPLQI